MILYGMELGSESVTLKRIGFFCFPIKHSTCASDRAAMDSGSGITGGGSGYAALLAHAE